LNDFLSAFQELDLTGVFFLRFLFDIVAMVVLVFGLYYRRYRDKELVTSASMFNVFIFCILTVLSSVHFSLTAGFGLFAILGLFTLRSEPIGKMELTYFFGSVVLAVICAVQGTSLLLVVLAVLAVLLGAYLFDHPKMLRSVSGTKISLDMIDKDLLSDPVGMKKNLSLRLGVDVLSYHVMQIDYITEKVSLNVFFRKHQ